MLRNRRDNGNISSVILGQQSGMATHKDGFLLFSISRIPEGVEPSSPRSDVTLVCQTNKSEGSQNTDGYNRDGEQGLELL